MRTAALVGAVVSAALLAAANPAARQSSGQATQQAPPAPPPAGAQQTPPQEQPQVIRSGINFIRVDVIITDKQGKPVLDLKQDEFRIKEDGKPQTIESFSVVEVNAATQTQNGLPSEIRSIADEQREAQRPDVRLFIILLDDYHVRRGNDMVVRKPLIDFIENALGPADMVAIMYPLTPVTQLSFTRNRSSLISAIEHFEGRRFNYQPRNEFEERYAYYPVPTVERIRNEVAMSALRGAATKLGGMREGRKTLIYVSEGFTNSVPPQLADPVAAMPGMGNPNRNNPNAQNSDRTEFFQQAELLSDLSEVFREANRNNTSIYAVDPRGLAAFEYDINQGIGLQVDRKYLEGSLDTLRALADNTDGRAIINRNDLDKGMRQIIVDSSGYYLLGYNSSQAPTDGKFHKIDVDVTRRGVEVRARKGYWAYTLEDVARATAPKTETPPAVAAALATLAEPPRGRPARFWVGTSKGENGKTKVTFVWEPITSAPGERRPGDEGAASVMVSAFAPDGRPLFRGRVPDQPTATGSSGPPGAVPPATATFEVPPGRMQLRMMVNNAGGQVMDSATQEVAVPDYSTPSVSFGTPRVYRARTPRELQAISGSDSAVPVADRVFARGDRVLIKVDAYGPGGVAPTVTARMLNRGGTQMSEVPIRSSPNGGVQIDLPLSPLAAGDYLLELTAKTEAGSAQEVIAFRLK